MESLYRILHKIRDVMRIISHILSKIGYRHSLLHTANIQQQFTHTFKG